MTQFSARQPRKCHERPLDSRTTFESLLRVFSNNRHPRKLHFMSFFNLPEKLTFQNDKTSNIWWVVSAISSLKSVIEWRRLSRFPAKMTVVHAHKLHVLSKLSLRNLKVSNRVLKCDVIKNYICEIYGIYRDILKEQNLKGLFAKK